MLKRALALTLSLLLLCAAALGETTRYGEVFDAQGDAGRLTVRFLWLSSISGAMTTFLRPTVEATCGDAVGVAMVDSSNRYSRSMASRSPSRMIS